MRNPLMQTFLARIATTYLTNTLHTEIKIDRLEISSLQRLTLRNFLVKDEHNDTLLFAGYFKVGLTQPIFRKNFTKLARIELDNADFKLKRYMGEDKSNLQFMIDFAKPPIRKDTIREDFELSVQELKINNTDFIYQNQNEEFYTSGVDFNDIAIKNLSLNVKDIYVLNDSIDLQINNISLAEKSGFKLDTLACHFTMTPTILQAQNLLIHTQKNDLDLDLRFDFESFRNFNDFIKDVYITTSIRPSLINLTEVGYFAEVMTSMDNELRLAAEISGTVANFKARELRFAVGNITQFTGSIQMNGLPEITETFIHLSVDELITKVDDIGSFRLPTEDVFIDLPKELDPLGKMLIKGKFTGFYNDFVSYASFDTDIGYAKTDILIHVNKKNELNYVGHLEVRDFNAGILTNSEEYIKKLDMVADLNGSGFSFDEMNITLDAKIDSLELFGNVYNELIINGKLVDKKYTGSLNVKDDYISLSFDGSVDYGGILPAYNFNAKIKDAYLDKINLIDHYESAKLTTQLNMNFMGDDIDNLQGIIIIDSTYYSEEDTEYFMKNLSMSFTRDTKDYSLLRMFSDFIDLSVEGDFTLREMPHQINNLVNYYLDTVVADTSLTNIKMTNQDFVFTIRLKNTSLLSDLFIPELKIDEGAKITGGYSSKINYLFCFGEFPKIDYRDINFINGFAEFDTRNEDVRLIAGAEKLFLNDTISTDSLQMTFYGKNNRINYAVKWKSDFSKTKNSGVLEGKFKFLSNEKYQLNFDQARIYVDDTLWTMDPANTIMIDTTCIHFMNLAIRNVNQGIYLDGIISANPLDTLRFGFNKFNLSNLDAFLQNLDIDIDGFLDGEIHILDFYNTPFYIANIDVSDLYFNKEKLGKAEIRTIWDSQQEAFDIDADLIYQGNIGELRMLDISGKYFPYREKDNFDIVGKMNKFKLKTLEPFIRSFSSSLEGLATGKLNLNGSIGKPKFTGELNLSRMALLIDYINVKYYFAGEAKIDNNDINFTDIIINDSLNNTASVSGHVYHHYFRDLSLDLNITTDQIAGLNTSRTHNSVFYGKAVASGNIRIFGPFDNLTMNIDVQSERGTDIKIPIAYGTDVGENDYIVFINNEIPDEKSNQKAKNKETYGMGLNLAIKVTNDADLQLFMPYGMGNIKTRGKGDMKMVISPDGNFTMDGAYVIDRGSFFFTLRSIINRDFEIKRGSYVVWQGDPYDAKINMKAVYKVKTTLGEFGPPSDSSSRVPVDCIISLSNRLLDPEIRFTVEFPDLKDDTKQFVYSRLDTNNQSMMSQQMISLLVLNSFMSSEGTTGNVGFNTFSLLTNQVNNLLSKISNDVDIGVNYRPGDNVSAQEVELALSTQLFDDRVIIDGNLGMRGADKTQTTENTNSLIGEVNVEVKITQDGRFRGKAFNKSNNNYLYKSYAPYTQGVGVSYTQDFNRIRDLFARKKKKEKLPENLQTTIR